MVIAQAHRIRVAIPHRTAFVRRMLPTPAIAPAITCVVDTGFPRSLATRIEIAAAVSAAKPPRGFSCVSLQPIVCTIRQPPLRVPRPIAACAAKITQTGTLSSGIMCVVNRTPVMMPMVFCASLVPCE